jgi:hypothetical protein
VLIFIIINNFCFFCFTIFNSFLLVSLPGAEETEQATAVYTQQPTNIISAVALKQQQQQEQKELLDVESKIVELDSSEITKDNEKTIIDSMQLACVEELNLDDKSIDIQLVSSEICVTLENKNLVKIEESEKVEVESVEVSEVQASSETAEGIKLADCPSSEILEVPSNDSFTNPVISIEGSTSDQQKSTYIKNTTEKQSSPAIDQIVTEGHSTEQQEVQTDSSEKIEEEDEEKPPLPLPTYLWEDIKRKKHQVN